MTVILDIDLDYFALFKQPVPWLEKILAWAERPVDFMVRHHHEAFRQWRRMGEDGAIRPPHLIIHLDEHHDMMSETPPVNFGSFIGDDGPLATHGVMIFCCSRKDPEGYRLIQLRDKVMGYLTDPTGRRRITLYKSNDTPWTALGAMMVYLDPESGQMEAEDGTKFKILNIRLKWGAKP
jgi:hypothetical protein